MRVGFIFPSSDYLFDPFRGDPFTHFHLLTILEETFGSALTPRLIDLRGIKRPFARYHIPECDLFLYSVYTLDVAEQQAIVADLRRHYPAARHIAGGPHANVCTAECQRTFDAVILGEGERALIAAIRDWQAGKLQPLYHSRGPTDINRYSFWRRHFLPKSATARQNVLTLKRTPGLDQLLATTALFSRGCPYRCAFCALDYARHTAPGIRFRQPALVEAEIEYLKSEYGIQGLALVDEIVFPLQEKLAIRHLEAIGRTNITWRGQCRVDGVTPTLAALARQAGCVALGLGLESVVQRCLDIVNKRTTIQQARSTIHLLKQNGIEARLYLIIGLPEEPDDIVDQTWQFIEETQPDLVYLAIFTVRPGTPVFNQPAKYGIAELCSDWQNTMHQHQIGQEQTPRLSFRYAPGRGKSEAQIIADFTELQQRVRAAGLSSFELYKDPALTAG